MRLVTSESGTSRHFAALRNLVAIGVIADIGQAAPTMSHYESAFQICGNTANPV
jgi:hypothetical protein